MQVAICLALVLPTTATALQPVAPFTGTWSVDLRTPAEKKQKAECGTATFTLSQTGNKVIGGHSMATTGCGRLNEGGEGSVKGLVIGDTAVLVVTSARNGEIVLGAAKIHGRSLHWQVSEEIQAGKPEGDSGLILQKGVLQKQRP